LNLPDAWKTGFCCEPKIGARGADVNFGEKHGASAEQLSVQPDEEYLPAIRAPTRLSSGSSRDLNAAAMSREAFHENSASRSHLRNLFPSKPKLWLLFRRIQAKNSKAITKPKENHSLPGDQHQTS
jgi:hypothetical protein